MALREKRNKRSWGDSFVTKQTSDLIACKAFGETFSHRSSGNCRPRKSSLRVRQTVWLTCSHWILPWRWYGVEVLKLIPRVVKKLRVSQLTKGAPRSLRMQQGKPKMQNKHDRQSITVAHVIFLHGKTNENRECSSTTISKSWLGQTQDLWSPR